MFFTLKTIVIVQTRGNLENSAGIKNQKKKNSYERFLSS